MKRVGMAHALLVGIAALFLTIGCGQPGEESAEDVAQVASPLSTENFGFFVFSDVELTGGSSKMSTAMNQMKQIDSASLGAVSIGDLTFNDTSTQWTYHNQYVDSLFDRNVTQFGGKARYLAVPGNHDVSYSRWTSNLPGQLGLGDTGQAYAGTYLNATYSNVQLFGFNSEITSGAQTSYQDRQTTWLADKLQSSTAQFKFAFFHQSVYSCTSARAPFAAGLPWVDLAERNNVDVIFSAHGHVYTRTCPKKNGTCSADRTGPIHVSMAPVAFTPRTVDVTAKTVTGTNSLGNARTDNYNCIVGQDLVVSRSPVNAFCYVQVQGCQATVKCYVVGQSTPFDTFVIDHCR